MKKCWKNQLLLLLEYRRKSNKRRLNLTNEYKESNNETENSMKPGQGTKRTKYPSNTLKEEDQLTQFAFSLKKMTPEESNNGLQELVFDLDHEVIWRSSRSFKWDLEKNKGWKFYLQIWSWIFLKCDFGSSCSRSKLKVQRELEIQYLCRDHQNLICKQPKPNNFKQC